MAMQGYTKLFNSILASTIWSEPDHTRIIWITMLAMADKDGMVSASVPGLANLSHTSVDHCEEALVTLSSPDRYSRSQEFEGRRIEKIDGGWQLLNYEKYKRKLSMEERREYLTAKQREYRARDRAMSTSVDNCDEKNTLSTHSDTDSYTDTKAKEEKPSPERKVPTRELGSSEFQCFWEAYPRPEGKKEALMVWVKKGLDNRLGEILAGLEAWKKRRDPQYMPYAQGWLNQDSWKEIPIGGNGFKHEERRRKTKDAIASVLETRGKVAG